MNDNSNFFKSNLSNLSNNQHDSQNVNEDIHKSGNEIHDPNNKKKDNTNQNKSSNKEKDTQENIVCFDCNCHLTKSEIQFSCNHYLCSTCLSRKILLSKFSLLLPIKSTLSFPCNCNSGELSLPISKCYSLLSQPQQLKAKLCKKHSLPFKTYCTECRIWLCDNCLTDFHNDYFKNHQTSINGESFRSHCFYHKDKFKTCICKKCNELICDECTLDNITVHINHPTYSMKEYQKIVQNKKKELKYKTYDNMEMFINDKQKEIMKEFNKGVVKSKESIDKGIQILQELKQNYIEKTAENAKSLTMMFNILKKVYENFYMELNEEKFNLGSLEFIQKVKNELMNISYSSLNFEKFFTEIENLPKSFQNVFDIKFAFNKLKYNQITSFDTSSPVTSLCVIKKNDTFITGHQNGLLNVYKNSSLLDELHVEIKDHSSPVNTIKELHSFPNGGFISGSTDKSIKVWSFETSSYRSSNLYYDTLVSTQRNNIDISNTNNSIQMQYNTTNTNKRSEYKIKCVYTINLMHLSSIIDIIELKDKRLASSGSDNFIKIWTIPNMEEDKFEERQFDPNTIIELKEGAYYEKCLCQINNDIIASGSGDRRIKLWSIKQKSVKRFLIGHSSYVNVLLLRKKDQLLSGGADGMIIVWDVKEDDKMYQYGHKVMKGHEGVVQNIVEMNVNKVVSCSSDKSVRIWDMRDMVCVFCICNCHKSVIYGLGVTEDKKIVTGGNDAKLYFYSAEEDDDKNFEDYESEENYSFNNENKNNSENNNYEWN